MAGYRSFLDIPSEIYEEAKSKGIDISSLALSGHSPDEAVAIVKGTPAPDNPLFALPKGIARGALSLTGGVLRGVGELTGSEALKSVGSGISEFAEEKLGIAPTSGTFTKVLGTVGEVIGLPIPGIGTAGAIAKGASLAGKLLKAERAIEGIGKAATKMAIPTSFGLSGYGTAREMQERYAPEIYESPEGQVRAGLTGLAHAGLSLIPFAEKFKFLRKLPVVGDSHLVYSAVSEAIAFPIVAGLFDLSSRFGAGVYADPTFTGELRKVLGGLVEDTTKSDVIAMMLAGGILGALRGRFITKHQDRLRELVTPEGLKEEARVEDIGVKEKLGEGEEVKGKLGGGKETKVEGEKGVIEESVEGKGSEVKVEGDVSGEGKGLIEKGSEEGIVGRDQVIFPLDAEEAAKLSKVLRDIINVLPTRGRYFSDYRKVLQQVVDRLERDSVLDLSSLPRSDVEKVAQFLLNSSDVAAFAEMFRTGDFVHLDRIKSDYFRMIADRYVSYLARKLKSGQKKDQVVEAGSEGSGEIKGEDLSSGISEKGSSVEVVGGDEGSIGADVKVAGVGKGKGKKKGVIEEQEESLDEIFGDVGDVGIEGEVKATKSKADVAEDIDFLEGVFEVPSEKMVEGMSKERKVKKKGLDKEGVVVEEGVTGEGQGISLESILSVLNEIEKEGQKAKSDKGLRGRRRKQEDEELDFDLELREVTIPQQMMRFVNVPFVVDVVNRNLVEFKSLFDDYKRLEEVESIGREVGEEGRKPEFLGEGNAQFLAGHISELLFKDDIDVLRAVKAEINRYSEKDLRKYRSFMEEVVFPWLEERLNALDAKGLLSFALGTSRTLKLKDNPVFQGLVERIERFKGSKPPIETGTQLNSFVTAYFLRLFHDSELGYYKKLDSDFLSKLASLMHLWYADPRFFGYGEGVEIERLMSFKELIRDYRKGLKSIADIVDDPATVVKWVKNVLTDIDYNKQLIQLYKEKKLLTKEEYDARLGAIEQLRKQTTDPDELAKLEQEKRKILASRETALSRKQLSLDVLLFEAYNQRREEFINFLQRGNFKFRDLVDKDILFDVYTFPERVIVNMHSIWKMLGGNKGVDVGEFKRRVYTYLVGELFGDLVPKDVWEKYLVNRDIKSLALGVKEALEAGYLEKGRAEEAGKLFITFTRDVFKNFFDDFWIEFQKGEATSDRFIELAAVSFMKNFVLKFGKDYTNWFYPTRYLELLQDYFKQTVLYAREELKLAKNVDVLKQVEFLQKSLYDINNQRLDVTLREFTELASRVFYGEGPEILEKIGITLRSKESEAKQLLNELGVGLIDENGKINIEQVDKMFAGLFKLEDNPVLKQAADFISSADYDVIYFGDNSLTFTKHVPGSKPKSSMYRLDGVLSLDDKFILQLYSVMRRYLRRLDEVGDELSKNRFLWNVLPSVFPVNVTVGRARRPLSLLLLEVRLPEYRNVDSFLDFFRSVSLNDVLVKVQEDVGAILSKSRLSESVKEVLRNLSGEKVILVLDMNKYRDYLVGKVKNIEDVFISMKDLLDIGKKSIGVEEEIQSKGRLIEVILRALFKESGIGKDDIFRLDKNIVDDVAFKAFAYKFLLREDVNKVFSEATSREYLANVMRIDNYVFNRLAKWALESGFKDALSWLRLEVENVNLPKVSEKLSKILQDWVNLGKEGREAGKEPLDEIDDIFGRGLRFERGNLAELIGRVGDVYPSIYMDPVFLYRFIQDTIARVVGEKVYVHIGDRETADVVNRVLFGRDDVFGAYMRLKGKDEAHIFLALTDPLEFIKTFGHEVWHAVWKTLGDKERSYLLDKYKSIEAVADAFGDYVVGKVLATEREKSIFERVKEIIVKILNFFRGYGFTDVETIFSKVWLGKYSRGEVKPEDIPISFYENMRHWIDRYGSVEQKLQFEEHYFRAFQKAQTYIQGQLNKMNDFVKSISGKGGIDEVRVLYEKGKGEGVGFWRKAFKYPVFDWALSRVRELYNRAERSVNEEILIDAENFFRQYGLYDENVKDVFRKLAYDFGVRGGFPFNVGDVLRRYGVVDVDMQKKVGELLAEWKRVTDKIYLEEKTHVLMLSFAMVRRKLADLYMKGQVTNPNVIMELNKRVSNFVDTVLKSSEFEVVYDSRLNIEQKLSQLGFDPLQVLEITLQANNPTERIVALLPKKLDERVIKELRSFTETQSGLGGIFNMLTPEGMKALLPVLDSFNSVVDGLIGEASALRTTYYMPLVRKGGKYNVTVFAKDQKGKFHPIFYYETDRYQSDYSQRNDLFEVVRGIRETYQRQGLRKDQYDLMVLDRWDGNGPLSEFVIKNLSSPNVERVIIYGRKKEGANYTFNTLSPGEQMIFINELVNKYVVGGADSIGQTLQDALSRYWASQSYARARAMARRSIPEEFGSVIEGFKKDFDEVAKEYIYRMTGHLKNNRFSFYFNEWLGSQEGKKVMSNPDLRDFVERYYKSLVTPASSFARTVYGIRMFASMYYLGLRLSTGLLNFVNALTYAWPLLTNRLVEKYRDLGFKEISYLKSSVETSKYLMNGFNLLRDLQKRGFLDRFFYLKPELLFQIKELYDVPTDQWVLRINGRDIIPSEREVLYLKGLYELFLGRIVESSFLRELRQEEMLRFGKVVSKAFNTVFWFFSTTERLARTATALSYLDLVYSVNSKFGIPTREVPITELRELIDKAFFDYTRSNRPYWANPSTSLGAIASVPLTLKGFVMNSMNLFAEMLGQKQYKALGHSLAMFFVLGGLAGIPFVDDILDVLERVTKEPLRLNIRNEIKRKIGDKPADFIVKGLPYMFGLDFSSSIKVELPIPKGFSNDEFGKWLFGVYENIIERGNRGFKSLLAGNYLEAVTYLMPYGMSLPLEAYVLSTEGLMTKGKRRILIDGQEFYLDNVDTFLRVLGFRPKSLSEVQDYRYLIDRVKNWYKVEKQDLLKKYRIAVESGSGVDDVLRDIMDFNEEIIRKGYYDIVPPVTSKTLRQALRPEEFSLERAINF